MLLCTKYFAFIVLAPHGGISFMSFATFEVGSVSSMAPVLHTATWPWVQSV